MTLMARATNPFSLILVGLVLSFCGQQAIAQSQITPNAGARSKASPQAPREDGDPHPLRLEWRMEDRTVGECSNPVGGCAKVFIRYPQVPQAEPGTSADEVNRLAEEWALSPWQAKGVRLQSPQSAAKSFFTSYRRVRVANQDKPHWWSIHRDVSVVYSTPLVISLRYEARSNMGDTTIEDGVLLATVDLHTGKRVILADLVPKKAAERLRTIAEKEFRAARGLAASDPLPPSLFREAAKFTLPENFLIDSRGLTFRYNVTSAAALPEGSAELFLSYTRLEGIVRTDGPLAGLAR